MTTTSIPRNQADLDDAWISEILGATVKVRGTEGVGVGSAFACQLFRLHLEGPAGIPASVVVKLPVEGDIRPMLDGIGAYGREVVFYRDLASEMPVRTPIVYAAHQASDSTDFVLVIEDLVDCDPVDQIEGFTPDQAEAAVDALARMHAWSWERSELLEQYADRFWPIDSEPGQALQQQYAGLFTHVWSASREMLAPMLGPAALEVADHFAELQPELIQQLATPRCLTHGELRADNLFIDKAGEPVLFDFQAAQQECGVRELEYLLGTSLDEDTLAAREDSLVQRYVGGLKAGGVAYEIDAARKAWRASARYNLMWPVMAYVRYEAASDRGKATLESMLRRLAAAIERQAGA
jgi:hypothetical protein